MLTPERCVLLFPTPVLPGEAFSIAQTLRVPTQLCPPLFSAPYTSPSSGASLKPLRRHRRLPSSEAVTGGWLGVAGVAVQPVTQVGGTWESGGWAFRLARLLVREAGEVPSHGFLADWRAARPVPPWSLHTCPWPPGCPSPTLTPSRVLPEPRSPPLGSY